jgi:fatty acid desaturase
MATNDRQRQFDEIVARLTADYPSLAGRRHRPRHVLITLAVLGGLAWALLSVAMVAWGAAGVILTVAVVAVTGLAIALDSYRHRDR